MGVRPQGADRKVAQSGRDRISHEVIYQALYAQGSGALNTSRSPAHALNPALHIITVCQIRSPGRSQGYGLRKIAG